MKTAGLILILLVLPGAVAAQESKVIVLDHADSLLGKVINGEEARELIGHVRLIQERVTIACDHALEFRARGEYQLSGNVVVRDSNTTMLMPRGVYHRADRWAQAFDSVSLDDGTAHLTARYGEYFVEPREGFFRGNVRVVDTSSVITCDSLRYFRNTRTSFAYGRVRADSKSDNVSIFGGMLEHNQVTAYSRMTVQPILVQVDTTGGTPDTLIVRSRVMQSFRDSTRRLIAEDSVRLAGKDIAGRAGYGLFLARGDSMVLRSQPVIWYQQSQVSGDSMRIYLIKRRLRRVLVTGTAIAVSQSDSLHPFRYDQMVGETMDLRFKNQGLDSLEVDVQAIGLYHLYDDTTSNGLNRISGDKILMRFGDGKLRSVKVIGGVEGQYYPENLVRGRDASYALPGARWRDDKPVLRRTRQGLMID